MRYMAISLHDIATFEVEFLKNRLEIFKQYFVSY